MSMPRCLLIWLFCLGAIVPLTTQAASGLPVMNEQRLTFSLQDRAGTERIAEQITAQTGAKFSGFIQLAWFDEAYSPVVQRLRQQLARSGISTARIMLIQQSGAVDRPDAELQVRIKQPMRQPQADLRARPQQSARSPSPCRYAMQNYRFNLHDEQGCALNNMLRASLVNPHKNQK